MTVRRYDSIRSAESAVRSLEDFGMASQSFSVLRAVERSFWRCTLAKLDVVGAIAAWRNPRFRVYVVCEGEDPVLVAPLERAVSGWRYVSGDYIGLDYVDALYAEMSVDRLSEAWDCMVKRMRDDGIKSVEWCYLSESSMSNSLMRGMRFAVSEAFDNYAVILKSASFDEYLKALDQIARHNLRRDRRRASEIGLRFEFSSSCGYGRPIDPGTLRECRRIYRRRQADRYGHGGLPARLYFGAMNYVTLSVPGDRGFLAVLRIGGQVAASMEGFVNRRRHALEVPRISMDSKFSEFGPGRLLVAECIRWMLAETDLRILDLCRGDERYKRELGGTRYLTRTIRLSLGDFA